MSEPPTDSGGRRGSLARVEATDYTALMLRCVSLALVVVLSGCAGTLKPKVRLEGGGYELSCRGPLARCLERAEKLCQGKGGYTVASAFDSQKLVGHEMGQSQKEIRRSEAKVYCGEPTRPPPPPIELKRAEEPAPLAAPAQPRTASAPRACVPGATQACIGKAGCSGGQACAADGSRFEPCDCGEPQSSPAPSN